MKYSTVNLSKHDTESSSFFSSLVFIAAALVGSENLSGFTLTGSAETESVSHFCLSVAKEPRREQKEEECEAPSKECTLITLTINNTRRHLMDALVVQFPGFRSV